MPQQGQLPLLYLLLGSSVVGATIATAATLLTTWLNNRHAAKLQKERWEHERHERAEQWRQEEQRRHTQAALAIIRTEIDKIRSYHDQVQNLTIAMDARDWPGIKSSLPGARGDIEANMAALALRDPNLFTTICGMSDCVNKIWNKDDVLETEAKEAAMMQLARHMVDLKVQLLTLEYKSLEDPPGYLEALSERRLDNDSDRGSEL